MSTKTPMDTVTAQAKAYSDAHMALAGAVRELTDATAQLERAQLPNIKRLVRAAAERQSLLRAAIEAAPEEFVKPRTVIVHGMKVGYGKGKGRVDFDDADQVVKLIKSKFPDLVDTLVKTEETPIKKAISALTVKEAKSIGCTVEGVDDVVIIAPVDSAVDKLVTALLKSATATATE